MTLLPVSSGDPHVPAHNAERDAINALQADVAGRIPLPTGAAYGDVLWYDGVNWVTTDTRLLEGNGRPEGQVAGPVGSRYINKTPDDGGVMWVKTTGGDSTAGWVCVAGTTGVRNIASLIALRSTGVVSSARLTRVNNTVEFYVDIKMPTNDATPYQILTLPAGFRPQYSIYGALTDNKEGADTGGTAVFSSGAVNIYRPVAGKTDRYHGTWLTMEAWPNALPGVPA